MQTSFWITLSTSDVFDANEYSVQAKQMADLFTEIFSSVHNLNELTKHAELSSCETNVEVSQSESGLQARAVVDLEAARRIGLNKTKLSCMLKAKNLWSNMKVEKRLVPSAESLVAEETGLVMS